MSTDFPSAFAASEQPKSEDINHGSKRERSGTLASEQEAKRPRLSPGKIPPTTASSDAAEEHSKVEAQSSGSPNQASEAGRSERRKRSVTDERQRSRRLFGSLLGSLNQPRDRTTKRRQEIEDRRKAELQQQDERIVIDNQRRQEQLAQQRRVKQVEVDEQFMRLRHRHMLDRPNFLRTKAEPHVYYRPWELTEDEEDCIDDQIRDAQDEIDEELAVMTERHDSVGRQNSRDRSPNRGDKDSGRASETPPRRHGMDPDEAIPHEENGGEDAPNDERLPAKEDRGKGKMEQSDGTVGSMSNDPDNTASNAGENDTSNKRDSVEHAAADSDDDHIVEGNDDTAIY